MPSNYVIRILLYSGLPSHICVPTKRKGRRKIVIKYYTANFIHPLISKQNMRAILQQSSTLFFFFNTDLHSLCAVLSY